MESLEAYERRLRRAGLPLFIEDYSAQEDIFTRAWPLLGLIALGEVLGAVDLKLAVWLNVLTLLGGLVVLVGGLAAVNRLRGRPALARPQRLGVLELAAFVVLPALLPLVFNGQTTSALVTALVNLMVLVLVWGVVGFGLVSILRWAGKRVVGQLASSIALVARALPLLFLFAVVLFLTTEVWQVFAEMDGATLLAFAALLVITGSIFVAARLPREVALLEAEVGRGPALRRAQRVNVGLVLFVSQALQVIVITVAVAVFFTVLGLLVINEGVIRAWLGHGGHELLAFDLLGVRTRVTAELLRVAAAICALSGVYYAIAVLTDGTYREEFLEDVTGDLRATFAVRASYLGQRAAMPGEPVQSGA